MAFRAFIAVDLPALPALASLAKELATSGGQLKLVDLEQIHLTLKFLGSTDEDLVPQISEVMQESVRGLTPFTVRVVGTGAFPSKDYMNVLWVGLENAEGLAKIASYLEATLPSLGFGREKRTFSPHATIARVRGGKNRDRVLQILEAHASDAFGDHAVDNIQLKRSVLTSRGPVYSTVEKISF